MRHRSLAAVVAVAALAGVANADLIPYNFPITPQQEVPPNSTNVAGSGQLLYDTVAHTFNLDIMLFGFNLADITGYHLHNAPVGVVGPIVINLVPLGNFVPHNQGLELLLSNVPIGSNEPALFAGNLYFNVHTTAFSSGQARGQIIPSPAGAGVLALAGLAAGRRRRR